MFNFLRDVLLHTGGLNGLTKMTLFQGVYPLCWFVLSLGPKSGHEVIKKIKFIPDSNVEDTLGCLSNKLQSLDQKAIKKLSNIASSYRARVRAIQGNLLESINLKSSLELRSTLNENSYYRVGSIANIFLTPIPFSVSLTLSQGAQNKFLVDQHPKDQGAKTSK